MRLVSILAVVLLSAGCAREPAWQKYGVARAVEVSVTCPNPFVVEAERIEAVAHRLTEHAQSSNRVAEMRDLAKHYRTDLSQTWLTFLASKKEGQKLFRCESLDDSYSITDGPKIISNIVVCSSNIAPGTIVKYSE